MAFLDNSGDIILDAVLTEKGRARMARGDGSFKIAKYALGDDEIDYGLYNSSHASGSAYYDLEILQAPVLEAFTNSRSSLKWHLITYTNNNLFYMPSLIINDGKSPGSETYSKTENIYTFKSDPAEGMYFVACDRKTQDAFGFEPGVLWGSDPTKNPHYIQIEQGLDTPDIPPSHTLRSINPELFETQYTIEIDNRFGTIADIDGTALRPNFIDDKSRAFYFIGLNANSGRIISEILGTETADKPDQSKIRGPRGTKLTFKIVASVDLQTSIKLFEELGKTDSADDWSGAPSELTSGNPNSTNNLSTQATNRDLHHIDTFVRVTGNTFGGSIDIPVRFYKCVECVCIEC